MTPPKTAALAFVLATSSAVAEEPPRQLEETLSRKSWYQPLPCSYSAGTRTDIYGTGIDGGTSKYSLSACQAHCTDTSGCQAAQYSQYQSYRGKNCFIYNSQNDNYPVARAINKFLMYKCTRRQNPHRSGKWYGPLYRDIYGTGIDGGTSQWSWSNCQSHCARTRNCKAAQYSRDQTYNGLNCFIYNNQNANRNQLKNFLLYYYDGHNSRWGPALARDIDGTGMGGSWAHSLRQCKARCKATYPCRAAQYSSSSQYKGYNCYIYRTDVTNRPQFMNFLLYKYNRAGCNGIPFCSRLYSDDAAHWTEVGKENRIANLALPVLLPIAVLVGVVSAIVVVRRVRSSQRTVAASAADHINLDEEMEILE